MKEYIFTSTTTVCSCPEVTWKNWEVGGRRDLGICVFGSLPIITDGCFCIIFTKLSSYNSTLHILFHNMTILQFTRMKHSSKLEFRWTFCLAVFNKPLVFLLSPIQTSLLFCFATINVIYKMSTYYITCLYRPELDK